MCKIDRNSVSGTSRQWLEILGSIMDFESIEIEASTKSTKNMLKLDNASSVKRVFSVAIPLIAMTSKKCSDIIFHELSILDDNRIVDNRYKEEHRRILLEIVEIPKCIQVMNVECLKILLNFCKKSLVKRSSFAFDITLRTVKAISKGLIFDNLINFPELFHLFLEWSLDLIKGMNISDGDSYNQVLACCCESVSNILSIQTVECLDDLLLSKLIILFNLSLPMLSLSIRDSCRDSIVLYVTCVMNLMSFNTSYNDHLVFEQLWKDVIVTEDNIKGIMIISYGIVSSQFGINAVDIGESFMEYRSKPNLNMQLACSICHCRNNFCKIPSLENKKRKNVYLV